VTILAPRPSGHAFSHRADEKGPKTLRGHRELILNYFRAKKMFSSGVVEGLNNKANVTMRKAYGFRTFRIAEIALYHPSATYQSQHSPIHSTDEPNK
jgi:hypothetical protein